MAGRNRLACFGARDKGTCDNHLTIRRDEVEARDACIVISASVRARRNDDQFCVRTVSDAPETRVKHRRLRGHVDAYQCCGKSLIGSALVRFSVRRHARADSISKRAPSSAFALVQVQRELRRDVPPKRRLVRRSAKRGGGSREGEQPLGLFVSLEPIVSGLAVEPELAIASELVAELQIAAWPQCPYRQGLDGSSAQFRSRERRQRARRPERCSEAGRRLRARCRRR
jgi:hypothetical protein